MNHFPTPIVLTASLLLMMMVGCTKTDATQKPAVAGAAPGAGSVTAQPIEPDKGSSEAEKIRRLLEKEAVEREAAEARRNAFAQSFKDGANAPLKEYKY